MAPSTTPAPKEEVKVGTEERRPSRPSSPQHSEDGSAGPGGLPDFHGHIDPDTFEQILEMDDDEEEREFSKSIVYDFFSQADQTFGKMDENLEKRDLAQLSSLGHFL